MRLHRLDAASGRQLSLELSLKTTDSRALASSAARLDILAKRHFRRLFDKLVAASESLRRD